ncbi:hypothetical protein E2562_018960 [Oryza meyeriana var. granulata]|uniref:Uncharacterized protein n=1 Tax=Oryza meyeriana var. granulata TaxID=110450 RepID=A0A6G1DKH2_9ORYZ|nr:hypothetical protein E2562_018960 [Oryza meyeriana var. granulata]
MADFSATGSPHRFFSSGGLGTPGTSLSPSCTNKQGPVTAEEKNQKSCPRKQASRALRKKVEQKKNELLKLLLQMKNLPSCDECLLHKEEQLIRFLQELQASKRRERPSTMEEVVIALDKC